ncbi:MAG: hypothetical protein AAF560_02495 [Acidobacteriota bacterium]
MCGIFGFALPETSTVPEAALRPLVDSLFLLSESRGKEAAGLAFRDQDSIRVFKRNVPASSFLRDPQYRTLFDGLGHGDSASLALIGHSRLVTNGSEEAHHNNQPLITDGVVGIHNGIIVNADALWQRLDGLERRGEVDSEILFGLISHHLGQGGSLPEALEATFELTQGQASIAALFADRDQLLLYTNNGSLYVALDPEQRIFLFASERHILSELLAKRRMQQQLGALDIEKVHPGHGLCVDLKTLAVLRTPTREAESAGSNGRVPGRRIVDILASGAPASPAPPAAPPQFPAWMDQEFQRFHRAAQNLRRCSKCVLPETMPFMSFDAAGVCNYCRGYRQVELKPRSELDALLANLRRPGSDSDCLIGLSGGRDSTYGLHVLKAELGMNPVAFTYDWGMVTDLARRNISRICGQLGIEHILVSADIKRKRDNIRRNVSAWLKKPDLGIIPLFMAGDKQYFYEAGRIKKQLGVEKTFLGENLLERTDFKSGYCGVPLAREDEDRVYVLPASSQLRMLAYYGKQYLTNPAYLNRSLLDTAYAFVAYYWIDRDYINLYRYVAWDEATVNRTLIDTYDWETAVDTDSTWRIGDGTAAFYNYIYYTVGGFSENDTFRSNQIREGKMDRSEALARVEVENQPRFETIREYCQTIGIDFEAAIRRINEIPRRFPL